MRTRKEQITELTEILYEAGYRFRNKAKPETERIILEAERRAEQRVREKISERVSKLFDSYDAYDRPCKQFVMEAIDAARENDND